MLFPCVIPLALFIGVTLGSPSGYSGHLQHISVPDYNPMLEVLGQHVDLKEIPTKVIRITKTVAIKVPVPYPVKVPHHVPYPVHVDKPYPVPVTKIVKVPEPVNIPSPVSHGGSIGLGLSHGGQQDVALYHEPSQSYGGSDYSGSYGQAASSGPQGYGDFGGHGDTEASINQGYSNAVQGYGGHEQYGESQQVSSHIAQYVPNQHEAYNGRESVQYQQIGAPAGNHQDNSYHLQMAHPSS